MCMCVLTSFSYVKRIFTVRYEVVQYTVTELSYVRKLTLFNLDGPDRKFNLWQVLICGHIDEFQLSQVS